MSVIEIIKASAQNQEIKTIEVPEWGDTVIYFRPITVAEYSRILKKIKTDEIGAMVDAIIMKAEDKEGKKIFDIKNRADLMGYDNPEVIFRIAGEILSRTPVEEFEKN